MSMEFSRQEYWSGLLFPTPGDLPHPGIEPVSPESPALTGIPTASYLIYFLSQKFYVNMKNHFSSLEKTTF